MKPVWRFFSEQWQEAFDYEKALATFALCLMIVEPRATLCGICGLFAFSVVFREQNGTNPSLSPPLLWFRSAGAIYGVNLFATGFAAYFWIRDLQLPLNAELPTIAAVILSLPLVYLLTSIFENLRRTLGWPTLLFPAWIIAGLVGWRFGFWSELARSSDPSELEFYVKSVAGICLVTATLLKSPLTAASFLLAFVPGLTLGITDHRLGLGWLSFFVVSHIPLVPSPRGLAWGLAGGWVAILVAPASFSWSQLASIYGHWGLGSLMLGICLGLLGEHLTSPAVWVYHWHLWPEDRLLAAATNYSRFRLGEPGIFCPFKGTWTVYQGFLGPWTHRGNQQHALDFVIRDSHGRSYHGLGHLLTDYYAFGQEVLAPTSGTVVALEDSLPDLPIGSVDNEHPWGNFVMIRDDLGYFVVLAHLKQKSAVISLGDYVYMSQPVGQCGNSGYSPEPHLHLQLQVIPYLGQSTTKFHLKQYLQVVSDHSQWIPQGVPEMGEKIAAPVRSQVLAQSLSFVLDEVFTLTDIKSNPPSKITLFSRLDPYWGSMYLTDGEARLYHFTHSNQIVFYHYQGPAQHPLKDLLAAAPRLPMIVEPDFTFVEIPVGTLGGRLGSRSLKAFGLLCSSQSLQKSLALRGSLPASRGVEYEFATASLHLKSKSLPPHLTTFCQLDPWEGITHFGVGARSYELLSHRRQAPPQPESSHPEQSGAAA